jgi:hypothetical protein
MPSNFHCSVFPSNKSANMLWVRRLTERRQAVQLHVWFDEWFIQPGDGIYLGVEHRLKGSTVLICDPSNTNPSLVAFAWLLILLDCGQKPTHSEI